VADRTTLTIAIPTYNGARTIARCLASILPQIEDGVEVLVCDNGSSDETSALVQRMAREHRQIRYARNETNVGFDRNVDLCFQRARGEFVWILSDDDVICKEGAVRQVLRVIGQYPELGAIFVDSRHPIKLDPSQSGVCRDGADFFSRSRFKCGLISSNIFRRSAWLEIGVNRHFDSGWVHIGFLVEALARFPSYVVCEELVAQLVLEERHGITRWGGSGTFIRTGLNLVRIYRDMPQLGYPSRTVKEAYLTIKGGYCRNIPLAKAKGLRVDLPLIREFVELYRGFPSFWLLDLPLLLMPGWLFRGVRALNYAVRPHEGSHGQ
jgi:glycosyltransferase involved in cell wall biosynthesis